MFCQKCGNQLEANSAFCSKCGTATNSQAVASVPSMVTSRWRRFWTYVIDNIFAFIFIFIISFCVGLVIGIAGGTVPEMSDGVSNLIGIILFAVYYILFEGVWQRSMGKFILGTKVVMRDGSKPPLKNIIGRSFARIIPFEPLSTLVNGIGWHDTLSGTLVVPVNYTPEQVVQIQTDNIKKRWGLLIAVGLLIIVPMMASIVLLALNSARTKARDAMRVAEVRQISTAAELYFVDNGALPKNIEALTPKYMATIPVAPTPPDGECTEFQNKYTYRLDSAGNYYIDFCLGFETSGFKAGKNTVSSLDYAAGN